MRALPSRRDFLKKAVVGAAAMAALAAWLRAATSAPAAEPDRRPTGLTDPNPGAPALSR